MQLPYQPHPSNPDAETLLIIIMGVSGSGKSTLARTLAEHYGFEYLDGDNFHSQEARDRMAQGLPLDDVMRLPWVQRMRDHFRAPANAGKHATLAFSGLKQAHRAILREAGRKTLFLFLHSDISTIQHRVDKRAGHFMAPSLVANQFENLERPTDETDVVEIDVRGSLDDVLQQAIALVDKYLLDQGHSAVANKC
jgi:gluconokinase